jgi:hypothetical protein
MECPHFPVFILLSPFPLQECITTLLDVLAPLFMPLMAHLTMSQFWVLGAAVSV